MAIKKHNYIVHFLNKNWESGSVNVIAFDSKDAVSIAKRKLAGRIEKEHLFYFHAKRLKK